MSNITYTWKLTSLKNRQDSELGAVVLQTYWQKIGTDEEGNSGSFSGATPFDPKNINKDSFVPFNQLTEEIVLNWIKAVVTGSYEEHVNEQILRQINEKKNPIVDVSENSFPWSPAPTGTTTVAPSGAPV